MIKGLKRQNAHIEFQMADVTVYKARAESQHKVEEAAEKKETTRLTEKSRKDFVS